METKKILEKGKRKVVIDKMKKIKVCKEWQDFKTKWDGKIPRKGTMLFKQYSQECQKLQVIIKNL